MYTLIYLLFLNFCFIHTFPEQGIWNFVVNNKTCNYFHVNKALFSESKINLKILCKPNEKSKEPFKLKAGILVREIPCFDQYFSLDDSIINVLSLYYKCPLISADNFPKKNIVYLKTEEIEVTCDNFLDQKLMTLNKVFKNDSLENNFCQPDNDQCEPYPLPEILNAFKNEETDSFYNPKMKRSPTDMNLLNPTDIIVPKDGFYLFLLYIKSLNQSESYDLTVNIEMIGKHGYLSANDWPYLPFYGIMSIVYLLYAIGWLIVSAMQWKDLLRIQYWIGAVILLGMIEKAVFYLEYSNINETGLSVKGAILFAELVSCVKRSLSRMLVIIVSLGYGIVKPRLGPMLQRVVCVGFMYFILSSIEATLRIYKHKNEPSNQTMMAFVPLALLDTVISWWVLSSLMQTTHILKLRRNLVKHQLYKNFTYVLTFAYLASIAFMIWVIHLHKITSCVTEWRNMWLDDSYFHILFSIMLLFIMILWRPTNNNQRYAFTPLLDASDDEDDENNTVYCDGLSERLRVRHNSNMSDNQEILFDRTKKETYILSEIPKKNKEENINSLVDTGLPVLIDFDDELINTKTELNDICKFCFSGLDEEITYGKKCKTDSGFTVHYFCLLFACGLQQNGQDEEGTYGFLVEDIKKELNRASRLSCAFCKKKGAASACAIPQCRVKYHLNCALNQNVLFEFFDTFSSYCSKHRPIPNYKISNLEPDLSCYICLEKFFNKSNDKADESISNLKYQIMLTSCCRKWLHINCIKNQAFNAGIHHFKCPLCNDKETFINCVQSHGIYIPDKDATWEEAQIFNDLERNYEKCDAVSCLCPEGRSYNSDFTQWEIHVCYVCGGFGTHVGCNEDQNIEFSKWECKSCREFSSKWNLVF